LLKLHDRTPKIYDFWESSRIKLLKLHDRTPKMGRLFAHKTQTQVREENYVNRLITGTLPDDEGIVLFEPDLEEGTEILFMLRSPETMMESVRKNSIELMKQIKTDGKAPIFGLYIDCAGRSAAFSETVNEEASEIQKVFNQYNVPLIGFYSGVEVAPLLGRSRGLDWTGVLLVLAEG